MFCRQCVVPRCGFGARFQIRNISGDQAFEVDENEATPGNGFFRLVTPFGESKHLLLIQVLGLVTILLLLILVTTFDLLMVWVLQCSVNRYGAFIQPKAHTEP